MQVRDDLRPLDGPQRGGAHRLVQAVFGFEQAGRVGEHELRVALCEQTDDGQAGGLRLWRDDRQVLADHGVQEGRLADVGAAGQYDRATSGHDGKGGRHAGKSSEYVTRKRRAEPWYGFAW